MRSRFLIWLLCHFYTYARIWLVSRPLGFREKVQHYRRKGMSSETRRKRILILLRSQGFSGLEECATMKGDAVVLLSPVCLFHGDYGCSLFARKKCRQAVAMYRHFKLRTIKIA